MSSKLIVLGSVNGQFAAAFKKLGALHAKNQFACCIATGNLFGEDDDDDELAQLLAGQIEVPVTTYFTVGTRPFPARIASRLEAAAQSDDGEGNEICPNLHYLGKRSVTKTAEGLRIVALGGLLVDNDGAASADGVVRAGPSTDACLPFHSVADETSLRGAHGADILLTAIWPRGILKGSAQTVFPAGSGLDPSRMIPASDGLADLVVALRPRYHVTASPDVFGSEGGDGPPTTTTTTLFYEREAFFHPERPDASHSLAIDVTRFLSLAAWGNAAKAKALYAFALSREAPTLVPAGCTPSPFLGRSDASDHGPRKRRQPLEAEPYSRFAQDQHHGGGGRGRHGKRSRRNPSPPPGPDRCFFCLSNPNLPTHMVASIGDDAYLATAKGPLPLPTTFAAQGLTAPGAADGHSEDRDGNRDGNRAGFPGHMIIVPLSHAPTITAGAMHSNDPSAAADNGQVTAANTFREMTRFRESLQAMVASRTRQQLGTVTWEISRQRNVHVHWQLVPVPAPLVVGGLVEAAFRVEAAHLQLPPLVEDTSTAPKDGEAYVPIEGDYFRVWIWGEAAGQKGDGPGEDKIVGKTLVMHLDEGARFDLQYGRRVVAKLLGLEATRTVWQECSQTEAEEEADVAAFRAAFEPWDFTQEA
ncbi:CwfJ domain protein [Sporothrix schenckii 1099-18]|uniref:Cwf19-like C-terminal domain-containing protein n=2 Tax=Sporothrix schenckii TaxID=29908 RepID=U7PWX2_SPOS1|nr:CwfJ domain protein [Sporothrix schenckii 1099-18]ERS98955.1 hypothetical protein HMPREF1624_04150 [Sporothrix schenckii ATCC 58251]KJR83404.1 CwfJ domain protein [Sporothrix schenckii 1099-18]